MVIMVKLDWISYRSTNQFFDDSDWVAHTNQVPTKLGDVLSQMIDAETGKRGYLITGEETYLEPYQESLWPDGTDSAQQEKPDGGNQVQVIP